MWFLGRGGADIKPSPGSRHFQMRKAKSGHWMLPISRFSNTASSGGITLNTEAASSGTDMGLSRSAGPFPANLGPSQSAGLLPANGRAGDGSGSTAAVPAQDNTMSSTITPARACDSPDSYLSDDPFHEAHWTEREASRAARDELRREDPDFVSRRIS